MAPTSTCSTARPLRQKAIAIIARLKAATDEWKEETGYGFSLYSTPSENLCTRFCRIDAKEFGVVAGVTDKGYYTNSFHLDVEKQVNPYDKLDFEAPLSAHRQRRLHLLRRVPQHPAQPGGAGERLGLQL